MSGLKSYAYPGFGTYALKSMSYTQAIRVGDRIHCSGQGGWMPNNPGDWEPTKPGSERKNIIVPGLAAEIDQAFANCQHNLLHAGGKGFEQVYRVVTYSTDIGSAMEHVVRNLEKWMPEHKAVWTMLGVKELGGGEPMHLEIDVEAYDPEGAAAARN